MAALVITSMTFVGLSLMAPTTASAADPEPESSPLVRSDSVSAMVTARSAGRRVEDLSQRTEVTQVFAEPDGSWTSDTTTEPVRTENEDGEWEDINLALAADASGDIRPAATLTDLTLSGGGDKVFASMTDERGELLEWRWPTVLPAPQIDGDTATYPDALPGVGDLTVTATAAGFSHNIVIPEQPAADVSVTIPIATHGGVLVENPGGDLAIETKSGDSLVTAPRPLMWDSSEDASGDPVVVPVDTTVTATAAGTPALKLTANQDLLSDPETVYPVTVDPSFSLVPSGDTWIQTPDFTSGQGASEVLRVGSSDGGAHKARSFLRFDQGNTKWAGKSIVSATLQLRNFYSGSCASGAIRVSTITEAWTGVTWADQPTAGSPYDDFSPAYGYSSSCAAGDAKWNVKAIVQNWANGAANHGVRLKAVDENTSNTERRYRSVNYSNYLSLRPSLTVNYNSYPSTPGKPAVAPGNAGYSTSTTPTLTASVSDPDSGSVRGTFKITNATTGAQVWSGTSGYVSSGGNASIKVPAGVLANGTKYTVTTQGNDGSLTSKSWSPVNTFTVDTSRPSISITSSAFTNGEWKQERTLSSNTVTFTTAGATSVSYYLDGKLAHANPINGVFAVGWVPKSGPHTITATAQDPAGNISAIASFKFGYGPAAFELPMTSARSTAAFPVQAVSAPDAIGASLSWRYAGQAAWNTATEVTTGTAAWTGVVANASDGGTARTGALTWNATAEQDPASTKTPKSTITAPALIEIRACFEYASSQTVCTSPHPIQLVPSAFGGNFPTEEMGPATVALYTGEMSLSEEDAADITAGVGRTFSSYDASTFEAGPFGPGWSTSLSAVSDTSELIDNTAKDGTFVMVDPGGSSQTYRVLSGPTNGITLYSPADSDDSSRLKATATTATLTMSDDSYTVWEKNTETGGWDLTESSSTGDDPEVEIEYETATGDDTSYPTWLSQVEPGVATTCTPITQTAGCRALKMSYTGNGAAKRVTKIERIAHGAPASTLATYTYDAQGRLTQACDPRPEPALCSTYTYTVTPDRTLLATSQEPGVTPWRYSYDSQGRLSTVKRSLDPDTAAATGDATWTAVYDLPTSTSGLPDLSAAAAAEWGQTTIPSKTFAVFSPNRVPAASPTASDLAYATLSFTDPQGQVTNTAVYGAGQWLVDTTWYDSHGNSIQTLDATGRANALSSPPDERRGVALLASSFTVYNAAPGTPTTDEEDLRFSQLDGRRVEETYGPATTMTLKDGTTSQFRPHTTYTYDDEDLNLGGGSRPVLNEGKPAFDLVVETRNSAASVDGIEDYDTKIVRNEYAPVVDGDGNGWTLGTPSKVLTKLENGDWAEQVTRYDTQGREIETRQLGGAANPNGSGADARSTFTRYYAPGASDSDCNTTTLNKPDWAHLVCKTGPSAQPSGNPIPTIHSTDFNADLLTTKTTESSGSTTRTTEVSYDNAGRVITSSTSIGTEKREEATSYDPVTGQPATLTLNDKTIATGYDTWGRTKTYSDSQGQTGTTTYRVDGLVASQTDDGVSTTFGYDSSTERRGLVTSVDYGPNNPMTATYNTDGSAIEVTYPNGIIRTHQYNETGTLTGIGYTQDDNMIAAFTNTIGSAGGVATSTSPGSQQKYDYDNLGRLTTVADTRDGECITRAYGFNNTSERTSLKTYGPDAVEGACQTEATASTKNTSYDTANRITNTGYTYDDLGRTLTIPATDTTTDAAGELGINYHVNDKVETLTQDVTDIGNPTGPAVTNTTSYTLDAADRIATITNTTGTSPTPVETNRIEFRYTNTSDSPTSIRTSTDAGINWTTQRYLTFPGIGTIGTIDPSGQTWNVANLHGDIIAITNTGPGLNNYTETTEYGQTVDASAPTARYGWLGSHQRSTDTTGGLILMGARLYNPATGTFTSLDPIQGGNTTPYAYPQDPINLFDVTGEGWTKDGGGGGGGGYFPSRQQPAKSPSRPTGGRGSGPLSWQWDMVAKWLGYTKTSYRSHGMPVYKRGKVYITPDTDGHKGGAWKMASSPAKLQSKRSRMGTYDYKLRWISE